MTLPAEPDSPTLDPSRQAQARIYARLQRRLSILGTALAGIGLLLFLAAGLSLRLRQALEQATTNPWLLLAVFAAVLGAAGMLLDLPLSYYTGFILPHRFDLSNQTRSGWLLDQAKGLLVGAPLGLLVLEVIYLLLRLAGDAWWLWAAGFMLAVNILLSALAPVVFMPLFNKFVPLGEEHAELARRLLALAQRANTRVQGVFKFDMSRRTKAANAALTGLGGSRRIILGDTLINEFTPDEIETVLAHELGHQAHKDIPRLIAVSSAATLAGFWLAGLALRHGAAFFGLSGAADPASLPLLALAMGIFGLVTSPLTNGFSRHIESQADDYALQLTGNGPAFASALTRLANQNLSDADPEPWVEWFFHSHPALGKRIHKAATFPER